MAHKAFEFGLGSFFSGSKIAADPVLAAVYRPVTALSRPNFGATLLLVAPEANNVRLAITFADTTFHLGWSELILGWLLALALRLVKVAVEAAPLIPISEDVRAAFAGLETDVSVALGRNDRCRVQEADESGYRRYLIHDFRRTSGAAPKKILL